MRSAVGVAIDAADEYRPRLTAPARARRDPVFYLSYPGGSAADQQGKGAFDTEFMKGLFRNSAFFPAGRPGAIPSCAKVGEALARLAPRAAEK